MSGINLHKLKKECIQLLKKLINTQKECIKLLKKLISTPSLSIKY
ncbi:M20 family metallo-hydrolase, partial [Candidatus Sulcia muelleri]|nr:M20 family metallo-hydrolase [Candidatus Karelsulcia muelleri]